MSDVALHGRRFLTEGEIDLWLQVTRTTTPLPGSKLPAPVAQPPDKKPGSMAPVLRRAPSLPAYVPPVSRPKADGIPPRLMPLEPRLRQDLARGRAPIEAVIDLHGMQQAEAHQALTGFVLGAQRRGEKLVLVVTGKGKGKSGMFDPLSPQRQSGILRRNVPHWLREPELRHAVVGFEEAAPAHGGSGALYVRLRRSGRLP